MVCNAMRPRSPLSHLMIKSLFLPNPRLSWWCRTQTSSDIDIPKKGHLCEPPSGVGGLLRHPRVASCPSKLPFADADLQSTTWFALCLLICTNLTPQFFGEPFSSSHSSVQQFFYQVNLNASTEACDKKQLRHASTLAKKPLCLSANVENKDQECVKTCKRRRAVSKHCALPICSSTSLGDLSVRQLLLLPLCRNNALSRNASTA